MPDRLAQGRERRPRGDEAADAAAARRPRAAVLHLHVRPGGGGGALPHHGRKGAGDHPGAARVDVGTRRAALRDRRPGGRGEDPPAPRIRRVDHRRRGRAAELRGPALRVPAAAARHGTAGADGIRAGARGLVPPPTSSRLWPGASSAGTWRSPAQPIRRDLLILRLPLPLVALEHYELGRVGAEEEPARCHSANAVYQMLRRFHLFEDRKSTRLNSSHLVISYAVFCLKKKKK